MEKTANFFWQIELWGSQYGEIGHNNAIDLKKFLRELFWSPGFCEKVVFCMLKFEKKCEKCIFSREIEVKRGEARTFLHLRHGAILCIPGVNNFHTLGVHSTYHGCTIDIPRGNNLHKRAFSWEIDVKRTNARISLFLRHRSVFYIPQMYNLHTTSVHFTYYGSTLAIPRVYALP